MKCAECVAKNQKSEVYPLRKNRDPSYDASGYFTLQQEDVFWDADGIAHSHMMLTCSKGHEFRHQCESCSWGKEGTTILPPTMTAVPPPPPPPVMAVPPPPAPPTLNTNRGLFDNA